jgi:hypothetical protein
MIVAPEDSIRVRREVRVLSCSASAWTQKEDQGRPKVALAREDLVVRNCE